MAHQFTSLTWDKVERTDPETNEYSYTWYIVYALTNDFGNWSSNYTAESSQLPEEPTQADVEALIMSLYGPGYEAAAPETV